MGIRARAETGCRAFALVLPIVLSAASPARAQAEGAAPAAAPAALTATAVLPVTTSGGLENLGAGLREWMIERLGTAGLEVVERSRLDAALGALGKPLRHGSDAPLLAGAVGAGAVLFGDLWVDGVEIELRLHAHSTADGQVLVGARKRGKLAALPSLAEAALSQVAEGLGIEARGIAGGTPRLTDWGALARARTRLGRNDLAGAWRDLVLAAGPTAEKVRAEIDMIPASPATRSRLANVSNRTDRNWLRVRDALRDPRDAETVLAGADAAMARGEPDRALRFYEKAAELAPDHPDVHFGRADALFDAGRGAEAVPAFLRAAELAPGDPRPYRGLARIETLPAAERARYLLRAGELQAARFEIEAARESLSEAEHLDGSVAGAVASRVARLEERLGNRDEALIAYRQAQELGVQDAEVLLGLGRMHAAHGDGEASADAFREALKQQPDLAAAHAGLGVALAAQGQDEAAQAVLEKAVASAPGDAEARRNLARVLARRGSTALALQALEVKTVSARERSALLRDAAALLGESGDLAGAERSLAEALALAPEDPDARSAMATLREAQGDRERAQAERDVAILLGATETPAAAIPTAAVPAPAKPAARKLDAGSGLGALISSFPTSNPGSGRPLGRVLLLGTRDALHGVARARRWLHPKRPNVSAIDLALLEAIAARFPIEGTPEISGAALAPVQALLAGSEEHDLIAAANQALGADAVFVARVSNTRPGAVFWSSEEPVLEVRLLGGTTAPGVFVVSQSLRLEPAAAFLDWNWIALGPWLAVAGLVGWVVSRRGRSRRPASAAIRTAEPTPIPVASDRVATQRAAPRRETPQPSRDRVPEISETPVAEVSAEDAYEAEGPTAIAERYREGGEFPAAAAAFEAAFDYDSAIDCYRRAGDTARALTLLEKTSRDFEAAQLALERGENDRAVRSLRNVDMRDPDYEQACRLLADLVGEADDNAEEKVGTGLDTTDTAQVPIEALDTPESLEGADLPFESVDDGADIPVEHSDQSGADSKRDSSDAVAGIRLERVEREPAPPPAESRYELLNEVGRGGMGVVYQARDRRLGRIVALKRLPEELSNNPTAVKLFLREARAAAALNHPNIVTLFDADQEAGAYYLTMEFLDGLPLDQILEKRGKILPRDAVRLGTQITTGLQYAHEQGVIHRDVKTSNLFFTRDRMVKIMDFGLAKMAQEVRRATVIGGTPYYMAPEQAAGDDSDQRGDLYALGVTLFELLTGTLPFKDGDITWHHQNTAAPDPRTFVPDLPDAFAELVLQVLEKDPAARPGSAAEVGERLTEVGEALDLA